MSTQPLNDQTQSADQSSPVGRLRRWLLPVRPPVPINPALVEHAKRRAEYDQNRVADTITAFAGSMAFVYIHVVWFACWIGFGVEPYPFGLLTMIVSLEAIFLSTFVMISQNRADAKRQVLADQQWKVVEEEDDQNKQLLQISQEILQLTKEVRSFAVLAKDNHSQNEQLLGLSRRVLDLTTEAQVGQSGSGRPDSGSAAD